MLSTEKRDSKEYRYFSPATENERQQDTIYLSRLFNTRLQISGPWRRTVWEKPGNPTCYIFAEEHDNEGSCPGEMDINHLLRNVIKDSQNVHVFVEHFIHANDSHHDTLSPTTDDIHININSSLSKNDQASTCQSTSNSILNNLRNCLEVFRVERPLDRHRIHFVDPRMDMVCVLPNGKLFDAISHYVNFLHGQKHFSEALLTIYEAFIHPLLSIVPDKFGARGRLTGVIGRFLDKMTSDQKNIFTLLWQDQVVASVKVLSEMYVNMYEEQEQRTRFKDNFSELKLKYTEMVNKFMDMWTLAQMFLAQNTGMTAAIVYVGSLHSLNLEHYMEKCGYTLTVTNSNKDFGACLQL